MGTVNSFAKVGLLNFMNFRVGGIEIRRKQ